MPLIEQFSTYQGVILTFYIDFNQLKQWVIFVPKYQGVILTFYIDFNQLNNE